METVIVIVVVGFVLALIVSSLNDDARRRSDQMRAYFARQNAIRAAEEAAAEAADNARRAARQREQNRERMEDFYRLLIEKNKVFLAQFPDTVRWSIVTNPGKYGFFFDANGVLQPFFDPDADDPYEDESDDD